MIELRMRTKTTDAELQEKVGKLVTDADYNLLLTGPSRVLKPDGRPLCVYLPGSVTAEMDAATAHLRRFDDRTDNRGNASGSKRFKATTRTRARRVQSTLGGSWEATPREPYCRLTAYTAKEPHAWRGMRELLQAMDALFREHVPTRWNEQAKVVEQTRREWVIPHTVFTTVTVNNTYPTGVHTDRGDLDAGFSCLAVGRTGDYDGGVLTFPEYRVGVDLRHGDLVLMDAHDWHGNTKLTCPYCGTQLQRPGHTCETVDDSPGELVSPERLSVVAYYRTKVQTCGPADAEAVKHADHRDRMAARRVGADKEG